MDKATENGFEEHYGLDATTLDSKGRIAFSPRKRAFLGSDFTFVVGDTGILEVYPLWAWRAMLAEVAAYSSVNPHKAAYKRLKTNRAEPGMNLDSEGRVVIPIELRDECNLKPGKDEKYVLRVQGAGDHLEIYNEGDWEELKREGGDFRKKNREQVSRALADAIAFEVQLGAIRN